MPELTLGRLAVEARQAGRKLLVPFLTAGYPDPETFVRLLPQLAEAGADIIEVGVPFSDPMADGRTIEAASWAALDQGMFLPRVLELCDEIQGHCSAPLVLMGYANPILAYGPERFFADAVAVGVRGAIVPDLPLEEAAPLLAPADAHDMARIFLIAPNTPDERIARIDEAASGMLYCVSVAGITGARSALPATVSDYLARVKQNAKLPFVVGFGISSGEIAARVAIHADGVVVGSALMDAVARDPEAGVALIREIRQALDG